MEKTVQNATITTADGKEIQLGEVTLSYIEPKAPEESPLIRSASFSGTMHFNLSKRAGKRWQLFATGCKAKSNRATLDRLMRSGMTKSQALTFLH